MARGTGFRRQVETGTSTRVYFGSRRGASFGASQGPRTLCAKCAEVQDKTDEGIVLRGIAYLLAWVASAWIGFRITGASTGGGKILGLLFVFGVPVLAAGYVIETQRRKAIAKSVWAPDLNDEPDPDALKPNESISAWLSRVLPGQDDANQYVWTKYASVCPPKVGQSITSWVISWPEWDSSWDEPAEPKVSSALATPRFDESSPTTVYLTTDTITSWAERIAPGLAAVTQMTEVAARKTIFDLAKYTKPLPGETFAVFRQRNLAWMAALDKSINLAGPASAMRVGDSLTDWLRRVGPLFLTVEPGESIDDVIPLLVLVAEKLPPGDGETALSWLARAEPLISESNDNRS